MESLEKLYNFITIEYGFGVLLLVPIIGIFAVVAQIRLHLKAEKKGFTAIIPLWNVVELMKIVGRPALHSLFVIIPSLVMIAIAIIDYDAMYQYIVEGATFESIQTSLIILGSSFGIISIFMTIINIELLHCFGKYDFIDYVMMVVFNLFYILNLGLAFNEYYYGPVYGKKKITILRHQQTMKAQLAN